MEFACHTWTFNDLSLREALGTIARLGFRSVDIGSGRSLNASRAAARPRETAAEIQADLSIFGLRVSDLYLMLPRISAPDDEQRARELELFRALVPFAAALGTAGITVSPGVVQPSIDSAAFDRTVAVLRDMHAAAHAAGLPLSIEPHMDSMAETPDAALRFVEAIPGLMITLDWADFTCKHVPPQAILPLLPHTRHVHIRQAARGKLQVPLERGSIDLPRMLKTLADAGYKGTICTEVLNMPGRHGSTALHPVRETARLRDALRGARDTLANEAV